MCDFEKFPTCELSILREELLTPTLDHWQAGERLEAFLIEHGFGVSKQEAQQAAIRIGSVGCSLHRVREEIERLALAA